MPKALFRIPSSRSGWIVFTSWPTAALLLVLGMVLFQEQQELSFLALFLAIYLPIAVNRRHLYQKLEAHEEVESARRERQLKALRQDLTTHLDTTTQAVRQDLTTHLDTTTQALQVQIKALPKKIAESSSFISYLVNKTDLEKPIIFEHGYAAPPSLLAAIFDTIRVKKPNLVLDLGSGLTTLITGFALRKNGRGKVVSWEHSLEYLEKTRAEIRRHGLDDWAEVHHTPLVSMNVSGAEYKWYSGDLGQEDLVDMLIVDGPPQSTGKLARFPAVPCLLKNLSKSSDIFLDDTNRKDEQEIVSLWTQILGEKNEIWGGAPGDRQFVQFAPRKESF